MIRFLFNTVDLCCEGFVDFRDLQDPSLGMILLYRCDGCHATLARQITLTHSGAPDCVIG